MALITDAFEVLGVDADETVDLAMQPGEMVLTLARRKAETAARDHQGYVIVGADTMVYVDGTPLGKPEDEVDATRMLGLLSGRAHEVYTGLYVLDTQNGKSVSAYERTEVRFEALSPEEIRDYIKTGEPMDKAGAYGIQGAASKFISRIEGCYYNVVGLPVHQLYRILKEMNVL